MSPHGRRQVNTLHQGSANSTPWVQSRTQGFLVIGEGVQEGVDHKAPLPGPLMTRATEVSFG